MKKDQKMNEHNIPDNRNNVLRLSIDGPIRIWRSLLLGVSKAAVNTFVLNNSNQRGEFSADPFAESNLLLSSQNPSR
jgi:hypothetical protein